MAVATMNKLDYLVRELATARAEATALRNRLPSKRRYSAIVKRAIVDGHSLMLNAFSEEPTSKNAMLEAGMSVRRWQWAVAFLRYAGIISMNATTRADGLRWVVSDLDQATALVERSAKELSAGDGYKRLRRLIKPRRI